MLDAVERISTVNHMTSLATHWLSPHRPPFAGMTRGTGDFLDSPEAPGPLDCGQRVSAAYRSNYMTLLKTISVSSHAELVHLD